MGLDMYMFRITKLTDDEIKEINKRKYHAEELMTKGYDLFRTEDSTLISEIKDYLYPTHIIYTDLDFKKIKDFYKIPKSADITGYGFGDNRLSLSFSYKYRGESRSKHIEISEEEKQKFLVEVSDFAYIAKIKEVSYWRKNYDLQDVIYDIFDEKNIVIENCGYYPISDEEIDKVSEYTDVYIPYNDVDHGSIIAYLEWY